MIKTLLNHQDRKGMWHQIVGNEDSWKKTSCTAMFGYAIPSGVNKGLLNDKEYRHT